MDAVRLLVVLLAQSAPAAAPCVPPGPIPMVSLIRPSADATSVAPSIQDVLIRMPPHVVASATLEENSGETLTAYPPVPQEPISSNGASIVYSVRLPERLRTNARYRLKLAGYEYANLETRCWKSFRAVVGEFSTG